MRILCPVVSPSAGAMPMRDSKIARGGAVRSYRVSGRKPDFFKSLRMSLVGAKTKT
jgi:hypothetical protein